MKLSRYAIPIALGAGAVVFLLAFLLLSQAGWSPLIVLIASAIFFILASLGSWLVIDSRSARQIQLEAYALEAEQMVRQARQKIGHIRQYASQIRDARTARTVQQITSDVEQLLARIRENNPNTLQSSVTVLLGHLENLTLLLDKYIDIQNHPRYYEDAQLKLQEGQTAVLGFEEFVVSSIQLVERGETLGYDVARKMLEATKFTRLT
jgi:hypothetical protein